MIFAAEDLGDLLDLAVLLSLPGVLVLAWLVGRLLGVRRSWTTTLLSGVIGWAGGVALSLAIASQRNDPDTGFTRNVWLFSTLGVMSASAWIELLAKPGTLARAQTGLTSIPHPIKALKRRGRHVSRYAQITRIAIRNGLGPSLGLGRHTEDGQARQVPFARRLRHSLEECGNFRARVSLFSDEHDERVITKLVNRTVLALVGGVVGLIGVMLINVRGGPPFAGETSLYEFFGYFSLFCSVVLIMRVIVSVLHDGVN